MNKLNFKTSLISLLLLCGAIRPDSLGALSSSKLVAQLTGAELSELIGFEELGNRAQEATNALEVA